MFESLTVVCRFVETVIFPELGPNNVKKVKKRTFREREREREIERVYSQITQIIRFFLTGDIYIYKLSYQQTKLVSLRKDEC